MNRLFRRNFEVRDAISVSIGYSRRLQMVWLSQFLETNPTSAAIRWLGLVLCGWLLISSQAFAQPQLSITQYYTLGVPRGITVGPDGALWFTEPTYGIVGRIDTSGKVTEYQIGSGGDPVSGITPGSDGALWFIDEGEIGRITTGGVATFFPLPIWDLFPGSIVTGPDGALWYTDVGHIGRSTTAGVISGFKLMTNVEYEPVSTIPTTMVVGPDGAMWFVEEHGVGGPDIGRITTAGVVTHYPIPSVFYVPDGGMTVGPDGAIWFIEASPANNIARVSTAGVVSEFPAPRGLDRSTSAFGITSGPDGALWFVTASGLGRIDTSGAFQSYGVLPDSSEPTGGIITGPDGAIWFTAVGLYNRGWIGRASVQPAPRPFIANAILPPAYSDTTYSFTLNASAGTPPYSSWTLHSGSLPPGITLDPSTGTLRGQPSALGTFDFSVTVQDSTGATSAPLESSSTVIPTKCAYSISPTEMYIPVGGGSGTVAVSTGPGCPWLAGDFPGALTFTSPSSGAGSGSVSFQLPRSYGGGILFAPFAIGAQTVGNAETFTVIQQGLAGAAPMIFGVADAESDRTTVVPGEWISIYGIFLSIGSEGAWNASDFAAAGPGNLPANLLGVSVDFGGIPAAVCYVSPTQVNAQVPAGVTGTVPLRVLNQQAYSDAFNVTVVHNAPSFFYYAFGSTVYVAATHADGTLVGDPALMKGATKARPGETISMYANGIAPSPSGIIITEPVPYAGVVNVSVGSYTIAPLFTGLVEAGVFQINVTVPITLPTGDYSVTVNVNGTSSPINIVLPVG